MIQRFYIHNYKCFQNFELPISSTSSALLIGGNGSGKTSIRNALRILQSIARGTNRISALIHPKDIAWNRAESPVRFELAAILDDSLYEYKLALELPSRFRELRVAEEELSCNHETIFSRSQAQVSLVKGSSREARFPMDWHQIALPLIHEQQGDPLHVFKSWLARMLILAPIPSRIDGNSEGESLIPDQEVSNFGEWFTGLLALSPSAYGIIESYLKTVMPDHRSVKNPIVGINTRSLSIEFGRDQETFNLPFQDLSDGEKVFFICSVVLAANEVYGPLFCFWDEPDNYLSLPEIGHFIMTLRRSFQSAGQILIASHNPEAIRQFSEDNTFLLHRRSRLEPTQIRAINEIRVQGDLVDALIRDDVEL